MWNFKKPVFAQIIKFLFEKVYFFEEKLESLSQNRLLMIPQSKFIIINFSA